MSRRKKRNNKQRTLSASDVERLLAQLPPPTWEEVQQVRKALHNQTREDAINQIVRAMPAVEEPTDVSPIFQAVAFIGTFLPNDGIELALSRLMIAATNSAMDCYARANSSEVPVRDLELNYAAKLSLVAAALGKALDVHRGLERDEFIETPVRERARKKAPSGAATKPSSAQASAPEAEASGKTDGAGNGSCSTNTARRGTSEG